MRDETDHDRLTWCSDDRQADSEPYGEEPNEQDDDDDDDSIPRRQPFDLTLSRTLAPNTRKAPTMQTAKYLTRNGNWSLYLQFSLVNIATGATALCPTPIVHPFCFEIINGQGKAIAKGTAPNGDFYPYGIKEADLIALLAMTDSDSITFYNRATKAVSDRYSLMTGWLDMEPAQPAKEPLAEYLAPTAPTKVIKRKKA